MTEELLQKLFQTEGSALFEMLLKTNRSLLDEVLPAPSNNNYYSADTLSESKCAMVCLALFRILEQLGASAAAASPSTGLVDCSQLAQRLGAESERHRLLVRMFTVLPALDFAPLAKTLFNSIVHQQYTQQINMPQLLHELIAHLEPVVNAAPPAAGLLSPPQLESFDAKVTVNLGATASENTFTNTLCQHGLFMKTFKNQANQLFLRCVLRTKGLERVSPCDSAIKLS